MTLEDKVHGFPLHALRQAQERDNVSAACRELGIARTVCCRWNKRLRPVRGGQSSPQENVPSSPTTTAARFRGGACDAASSYAWARVIPARNAEEGARFLTEVLVPGFARAQWKLPRFQGNFDQACRDLGIPHSRRKPRHA